MFEMIVAKESQHITKTLVLAMQFSRSAPRLDLSRGCKTCGAGAPSSGSTAGRARTARGVITESGIAPSKQSSEDRCHGRPVVPEPARLCPP